MDGDVPAFIGGAVQTRDTLQAEVDDILAGECLFCGDLMIRSITVPLLAEGGDDPESRMWEI